MSVDNKRLKVVLCWHMHQPEYRNALTGEYILPWTYLHGIKDYVDMAAHIEEVPGARAVFNFAPTLLEQLDDYAKQVTQFLKDKTPIKDAFLQALASEKMPSDVDMRMTLIKNSLRANKERLINRFPAFHQLSNYAQLIFRDKAAINYVNDHFIEDIITWYHLAWLGETIRRDDKRVQQLMKKENLFTYQDRLLLMEVINDSLSGLIGRYKKLREAGKIEISVTPFAHPIIPILLDVNTTKEAMPDALMPEMEKYPGGEERVQWHVEEGYKVFEKHFGYKTKGCWPSEGSISTETLKILEKSGFSWAASGQAVLSHTAQSLIQKDYAIDCNVHQAFCLEGGKIHQYFRDDGLSDLIGFTYSKWHADDAVNDFINHLENINCATIHKKDRIVSVILDGENAWEYYPDNAYHFLSALYQRLANHPEIQLTTFEDASKSFENVTELPYVVAGSWVYALFLLGLVSKQKIKVGNC